MRSILRTSLVASLPLAALFACQETRTLPACGDPALASSAALAAGADPIVLAAGDIAYRSDLSGARATATLLDGLPGAILALGDNAYENGSLDDYLDLYDPTWGRHRWRTRAAVGNHEWHTPHAGGYFAYFCGTVGEPFKGYYSFDIGAWHLVALNSNCAEPGYDAPSCAAGSEQEQWLRADLAAHPSKCTIAFWHHPRFSSGGHGDNVALQDLWQALHDAGADVVLNGHSHDYERFAPQDAAASADAINGIREFVVGTGGADLTQFGAPHANSEVRHAGTWGVLKLTLHASSYDWVFQAVDGSDVDHGSGDCH